jgi:UDP-N-acetylmuramoyl-L-alanyl-D-glutamate--2,6-diaminopimelate ligase
MGVACGRIGTLGFDLAGQTQPSGLTTPTADSLSRWLGHCRARGAGHVAMEVSSMALAAGRVDALCFRVAALTNLTRDHLDDHGTFEAYAAAKERLFVDLSPAAAVLNVDDAFGARLAQKLPSG